MTERQHAKLYQKPLSDFIRKPHPRPTPQSDSALIQNMLQFLSEHSQQWPVEPGTQSRLAACLKQVKAKQINAKDVIDAWSTLPWRQVRNLFPSEEEEEEEPPCKKNKVEEDEDVLIVDTECEESAQETEPTVSAVNETQVLKRFGLFAKQQTKLSKACLAVLDTGVKIYFGKLYQNLVVAAFHRGQSTLSNFPCHMISSEPRKSINNIEEKERLERVERLKTASLTQSKASLKNKGPDVNSVVKNALEKKSKPASIPSVPQVLIRADEPKPGVVTLGDVRFLLETDPNWRKSSVLQRLYLFAK